MKKLVLTLALALSGAAGAHGVWVAQHYGEYGIVYGMGAYDDAYAGKKVRAVNGLDENLKPTPVQTRGHMQHTFVEPQKAAVVTVVFDNDLWRKTPEGKWKELKAGENAPADEVSRSLKYNISILKPYQGKLQPFADLPVQIIPDQDPSQLKQGEAFTVTVYNCKPPPPFASNDTTFYKLPLSPRQNLLHLNQPASIFTCRLLFWLNLCSM